MHSVLIANRGEIAVRIARTARAMGLRTVLAASDVDTDSLAARSVDEVRIVGPAPAAQSYLNADAILQAALDAGVDAIHPGYGFLAENAVFASRVIDAGLRWVGPSPDAIAQMGDKVAALAAARAAGVPVFAGSGGALGHDDDAAKIAAAIGFPVMIKAAAGGGGRGIRVVRSAPDFDTALDTVRAEAKASFGDDTVYLERFVEHARHVEVQILGDGTNVIHLGDRDCSMQRRSQKVIEEAPAPDMPDEVRQRIRQSAVDLARSCAYVGAGTVEFLYDPARQEAAFIEMNTRIQVEHPVTEMITGLDLIEQQLRIAAGERLALTQDDVTLTGHALEFRINAEDPARGFFPSPGLVTAMRWPEGPGLRIDSGVEQGCAVQPFYDSMVAKLIVHAASRAEAIESAEKALAQVRIEGVATTVALHQSLIATTEFAQVAHHTTFIENTPELLEVTQ